MHAFFKAYLERLEALHADIAQVIDGLPPQALDWVVGPAINSIAVLVTHLAGAERYWIGDVAGQTPSNRDRAAEFRVQGLDSATLQQRLDTVLAECRTILAGLTIDDLSAERLAPRDQQFYTVAWALLHALEHSAQHLGHLQLTRQYWEQQGGQ